MDQIWSIQKLNKRILNKGLTRNPIIVGIHTGYIAMSSISFSTNEIGLQDGGVV